jgi:hypothetical protein
VGCGLFSCRIFASEDLALRICAILLLVSAFSERQQLMPLLNMGAMMRWTNLSGTWRAVFGITISRVRNLLSST